MKFNKQSFPFSWPFSFIRRLSEANRKNQNSIAGVMCVDRKESGKCVSRGKKKPTILLCERDGV